jgi:molecular chaperone GrpE (heat shock protein)
VGGYIFHHYLNGISNEKAKQSQRSFEINSKKEWETFLLDIKRISQFNKEKNEIDKLKRKNDILLIKMQTQEFVFLLNKLKNTENGITPEKIEANDKEITDLYKKINDSIDNITSCSNNICNETSEITE